ncbi:nucleoside-diphosphate kinase [Candidatus Woesearchaeota archaeon]|jgi:nucleoside-diphosphate kinase|nr:nucleoside-diphosphate kinase [Candidatus Woesearchaeota archaeon]MBT4388006.1 nucleoside-diphosphate kinase [Candidatus Woesearchaeota archaeon]MBT4595350.1 nucleoside-diphosphate kinase [Candidatus Woesearchaeota archaeon]MBT5741245.1 nucleoside-diphosphate kinase [Candidatus Woesearchaeota archaeon]MBT6505859.1 nucleoside-diphosphate kinase [Candidatus Woesearchaeota archaeon]
MIQNTLILIKPDGVQRSLSGEIIKRLERTGLKIIGMKMVWVQKEHAENHYNDIGEKHGQRVLDGLTKYLSEGPVIAVCLKGVDSINVVRKLIGSTYPNESTPGTIRGDFCHISKHYANTNERIVANLIHASADENDAKRELTLWFDKNELHDYQTVYEKYVI